MMPSIYTAPTLPQNGLTVTNSGAVTVNNTFTAPGGVITNVDKVTFMDLDSAAFKTPIDALINLWVTRYGNEWVDLDKIMEDDFFSSAYKRLKALGQLETHYLTDRSRFVCRKPT